MAWKQARAAKLVDAVGRRFHGDAGVDGGLTGRVLAGAGRQNLAHDDFVDVFRRDTGAFQRGADGDFAQVVGGDGAESAVEGADGGAGGAGDNDFSHSDLSSKKHIPRVGRRACPRSGLGRERMASRGDVSARRDAAAKY